MSTRLSALDIKKKEFEQKMRGYDPIEVKEFLERASAEVEALTVEKRQLEEKLADTQKMLDHYLSLEQTLERTLVAAQQTAVKMEEQARKESELIMKEAEMRREQALTNITRELDRAQSDVLHLRTEYESTLLRMKALMSGFTKFVDSLELEPRTLAVASIVTTPIISAEAPSTASTEPEFPSPTPTLSPGPVIPATGGGLDFNL